MTTAPISFAAETARLAAHAEARERVLDELVDIGMDLARGLRIEALDAAANHVPQPPHLGKTFADVSRAVRLTLYLQDRFDQPVEARMREAEAARIAEAARAADERERKRVLAILPRNHAGVLLTDMIDAEVRETERGDREQLVDRLHDRLDELEPAEIVDVPLAELIERVCADLGVKPRWDIWNLEALKAQGLHPPSLQRRRRPAHAPP